MGTVFYLTFGSLGPWLSKILAEGISWWVDKLSQLLTYFSVCDWVCSLILEGICPGVGSVLSFLPTIGILFFCLSILETCGYIQYTAHAMDRVFWKIGLTGQSMIPLLTGFGCSVPAIMAAGKLKSRHDKFITIAMIPFMSCSAKLPIYSLITTAFFGKQAVFVILSLYLTGILASIPFASLLHKICGNRQDIAWVSDHTTISSFHRPNLHTAIHTVWINIKDFTKKAFTVIFLGSMVIWFLENFDCNFFLTDSPENSILAAIGRFLAPVFAPLGLGDWRAVSALISGLSAKEAVVSTLAVMAQSPVGSASFTLMLNEIFTPLTAVVFMLFCLFYIPCIATLATVSKELGGLRYAIAMVIFQISFAWIFSFLLYRFGVLLF